MQIEKQTNSEHPDAWNDLVEDSDILLRKWLGKDWKFDEDEEILCFVHAEDIRYPRLIFNWGINFGVSFDPKTLVFEEPGCICYARYDDECCCDHENINVKLPSLCDKDAQIKELKELLLETLDIMKGKKRKDNWSNRMSAVLGLK